MIPVTREGLRVYLMRELREAEKSREARALGCKFFGRRPDPQEFHYLGMTLPGPPWADTVCDHPPHSGQSHCGYVWHGTCKYGQVSDPTPIREMVEALDHLQYYLHIRRIGVWETRKRIKALTKEGA